MHICANCDDEGWVCEKHPEVPWMNGDGCCGPGMPCVCNPVKAHAKKIEEARNAIIEVENE